MPGAPRDFFSELPSELPPGEPYYYLSALQRGLCKSRTPLVPYADYLPGWVPHRCVADALGHSHEGVDSALKKLSGRPYVWGTEFENVHTFWHFTEPSFVVRGVTYHGCEDFFHSQKPKPFDPHLWDGPTAGKGQRDQVMREGLRKKFSSPVLRELLVGTHPHPLLAIKPDSYWGVTPKGDGENMLARLLMEYRYELISEAGSSSAAVAAVPAAPAVVLDPGEDP